MHRAAVRANGQPYHDPYVFGGALNPIDVTTPTYTYQPTPAPAQQAAIPHGATLNAATAPAVGVPLCVNCRKAGRTPFGHPTRDCPHPWVLECRTCRDKGIRPPASLHPNHLCPNRG